jgi:hypothetical protein
LRIPGHFTRLAAAGFGAFSALLILAAGNLFFAGWLFFTRENPFWAAFWTVGGAAFAAYGIVGLLALARREAPR